MRKSVFIWKPHLTFLRFRLLDKQIVTCPNSDSCSDELQRGNLDDHLKYRCSGTLVACQYAGAGCDFRGPKKAMTKHHGDCQFKKQGKQKLHLFRFTARRTTSVRSFINYNAMCSNYFCSINQTLRNQLSQNCIWQDVTFHYKIDYVANLIENRSNVSNM